LVFYFFEAILNIGARIKIGTPLQLFEPIKLITPIHVNMRERGKLPTDITFLLFHFTAVLTYSFFMGAFLSSLWLLENTI